eukprot:c8919_g1_i1.p1 GENE.c8919_g1_i1~~c8919_g1_i1.p1  ORF type:complete len:371 (-),score=82.68 c8919_g1_i1:53-1165(-)
MLLDLFRTFLLLACVSQTDFLTFLCLFIEFEFEFEIEIEMVISATFALSDWLFAIETSTDSLRQFHYNRFAAVIALASAVFQKEVLILGLLIIGFELLTQRLSIAGLGRVVAFAVGAAVTGIVMSSAVDLLFGLNREWSTFFVIGDGNTSDNIGYWLITTAIPRVFSGALALAIVGIVVEPRVQVFGFISVTFLVMCAIWSQLTVHSLLFVLPLVNLIAAVAMSFGYKRRFKNTTVYQLSMCSMIFTALCTVVFVRAAMVSYPTAKAVMGMYRQTPLSCELTVRVEPSVTLKGFSQFLERSEWKFVADDFEGANFVVTDQLEPPEGFVRLFVASGIDQLEFSGILPSVRVRPQVYVNCNRKCLEERVEKR